MNTSKTLGVWLLVTAILCHLAIDLYLPAFPILKEQFNVSSAYVEFSLTIFLWGMVFSQIICGPLSDYVNKLTMLRYCLLIFTGASLAITISPSFYWFLLFRFIEGSSTGGIYVISRALARETLERKELYRFFSYASFAWSFVPLIAPAIGSYIIEYFPWQVLFILISFSTFIVFFKFRKNEDVIEISEPKDLTNLRLKNIMSSYISVLKQPDFLMYSMASALIYGMLIAYTTASSLLFQNRFNLDVQAFGYINLVITSGYAIGSLFTIKFANLEFLNKNRFLIQLNLVLVILSVFLIITKLLGGNSLIYLSTYLFILFLISGLTYPSITTKSLIASNLNPGITSASLGNIQLLCCSFMSLIQASIVIDSDLMIMLIVLISSISCIYLLKKALEVQ